MNARRAGVKRTPRHPSSGKPSVCFRDRLNTGCRGTHGLNDAGLFLHPCESCIRQPSASPADHDPLSCNPLRILCDETAKLPFTVYGVSRSDEGVSASMHRPWRGQYRADGFDARHASRPPRERGPRRHSGSKWSANRRGLRWIVLEPFAGGDYREIPLFELCVDANGGGHFRECPGRAPDRSGMHMPFAGACSPRCASSASELGCIL